MEREMTQLEILKYAYCGALEVWSHERYRLQKNPDSVIAKHREQAADEAFNEIRNLLMAEEQKAQ